MAGHFVVGWLLAKHNLQKGALQIDVVDDGGEKDCEAHCGCCCEVGLAVGGEHDLEDVAFLQENLIDEDELELMLLALPPLCTVFLRRLSVLL